MNALPHKTKVHNCRAQAARFDLSREVLVQLETLDDTIFDAINGCAEALDQSANQWRRAVRTLGPQTVEESRKQYLRRAESEWARLKNQPFHPPHKTFAALEIISLLTGKTI